MKNANHKNVSNNEHVQTYRLKQNKQNVHIRVYNGNNRHYTKL